MRGSGGDNRNSGTTSSDVASGSDSAIYTSLAGNWNGTDTFTPTDGSTPASTISAGMYAALAITGETFARAVALITTVNAGVNGTIIINTTTKYGTVPTSNNGSRELRVGGSLADFGICATNAAWSTGTVPQATRLNTKAATYANTTTARTWALAATATLPMVIQGYKNTPGDQINNNVAINGTDIPHITFTSSATFTASATRLKVINCSFIAAASNPTASSNGSLQEWIACRFESTGTNALSRALNAGTIDGSFIRCWCKATSSTTSTIVIAGNRNNFFGCYIEGGTANVAAGSLESSFANCVFNASLSGTTDGFTSTGGRFSFANCSFYGAGSSSGHAIVTTTAPTVACYIINCAFQNFLGSGKYVFNNSSGTNTDTVKFIGNGYYNNTALRNGVTEDYTIFDNGSLSSAIFANPGSGDFSILSAAQGIGFPSVFENISAFRAYIDIGAIQDLGMTNRGSLIGGRM